MIESILENQHIPLMFSFIGPQHTCPRPQALVVLLHGYGMDGAYFDNLAPHFQLPEVFFWTPDGLEPCQDYPPGRQWFSFRDAFWQVDAKDSTQHTLSALARSWPVFYQGMDHAATIISKQIQEEITRCAFDGPVFIGGFSQGAGTALHIGLHKMKVAGVLCFSGFYLPQADATPRPTYTPPVFWCHGTADETIPLSWMEKAYDQFKSLGLAVEPYILKDLDHRVSTQGIAHAREFIVRHFT
jgi:phospholipase/carboxylesterase